MAYKAILMIISLPAMNRNFIFQFSNLAFIQSTMPLKVATLDCPTREDRPKYLAKLKEDFNLGISIR